MTRERLTGPPSSQSHSHRAHETFSALARESEGNTSVRPWHYLSGLHSAFLNPASAKATGSRRGSRGQHHYQHDWYHEDGSSPFSQPDPAQHHPRCWGTAQPPWFCQGRAGGWREHTLHITHVFILLNRSLF